MLLDFQVFTDFYFLKYNKILKIVRREIISLSTTYRVYIQKCHIIKQIHLLLRSESKKWEKNVSKTYIFLTNDNTK